MNAAYEHRRAIEELRARLDGRASPLLTERLVKALEDCEPNARSTEDCIKRIRVAVRMFVDEGLAEDIAAMLSKELSYPS